MIDFLKEVGMAFLWLMLGYLVGERGAKRKRDEEVSDE